MRSDKTSPFSVVQREPTTAPIYSTRINKSIYEALILSQARGEVNDRYRQRSRRLVRPAPTRISAMPTSEMMGAASSRRVTPSSRATMGTK